MSWSLHFPPGVIFNFYKKGEDPTTGGCLLGPLNRFKRECHRFCADVVVALSCLSCQTSVGSSAPTASPLMDNFALSWRFHGSENTQTYTLLSLTCTSQSLMSERTNICTNVCCWGSSSVMQDKAISRWLTSSRVTHKSFLPFFFISWPSSLPLST